MVRFGHRGRPASRTQAILGLHFRLVSQEAHKVFDQCRRFNIDSPEAEDFASIWGMADAHWFDEQDILILLQFPPEDAKALEKAIRKKLKSEERRRSMRSFVYAWAVIGAVAYIDFVILAFSKAQSLLETEVVAGFVLLYATTRFRFALAFPGIDERFSYIHRVLGNKEPPAERRLDGWSENWGRIRGVRNESR